MKSAHKTQIAPRNRAKRRNRRGTAALWAVLTIIFPGAGPAAALSPEAREVLDILDRRIAAAEAGQATREAFLELAAEAPGCRDWSGYFRSARARRDADLREALREACPELAEPPARRRRGPRGRLRAHHSVQPQEEPGSAAPALDGSLHGPLPARAPLSAGAEASAAESEWRRRRLWLAGKSFSLQAGQLRFAPPGPDSDPASPSQPRLDFVSGRRGFPATGVTSGVEGPLEARATALDGLGATLSRGPWQAGAFAAWNRLRLPGQGDEGLRGDALAGSLLAAASGKAWTLAVQALEIRLEPAAGEAATVRVAGAELAHASGWRIGGAASGAGSPSREGPGAYGEVAWEGGNPGGYLLELRQASPGWANPLAAAPALAWDTLPGGWRLPGRGEGGLAGRSRLDLLEAEGFAAWALADGEAAWLAPGGDGAEGLLAGEGRMAVAFRAGEAGRSGALTGRAGASQGWRRDGLPGAGAFRSWSQGLGWERRAWRIRGSLSRLWRGSDDQESWPFSLEASGRREDAGSWRAAWSSADLAGPGRDHRLALGQTWRLGGGLSLSQSLRLPLRGLKAGEGIAYGLGMEYSGR